MNNLSNWCEEVIESICDCDWIIDVFFFISDYGWCAIIFMLDTRDLIPFQVFRRGYSFRKRLVKKCLICHAPKKVGSKENFQLSNASHSQPFLRIFKDFPILSNPEQTTIILLFGGLFLDKNPRKCNINTRNIYEDHLWKLPELTYNQAQIQVFESTTQNFTNFLEQTLNKPPWLDIVWN